MFKICDEKGRVLMVYRDNKTVVFVRYQDMTKEDKEYMIRLFNALVENKITDSTGKKISNIEDFLNFKDDDEACG